MAQLTRAKKRASRHNMKTSQLEVYDAVTVTTPPSTATPSQSSVPVAVSTRASRSKIAAKVKDASVDAQPIPIANLASGNENLKKEEPDSAVEEKMSLFEKDAHAARSLWSPPFSPVYKPPQRSNFSLKPGAPKRQPAAFDNTTTTIANGNANGGQEKYGHDPNSGSPRLGAILDHRRSPTSPNLFEVLIRWDGPKGSKQAPQTWEPEEAIHEDVPSTLFAYWHSIEGGREAHMRDPGLWHVFAIKGHRVSPTTGAMEVRVEWVGSDSQTWEPEKKIARVAPEDLEAYWTGKGGRESVLSKKRKGPNTPPRAKRRRV